MKADAVFYAAKKTFERYGDEAYTKAKADNFLWHCWTGLEQDIPKQAIEEAVYSMLDADSEQVFWANLQAEENNE